jgi:hypothetical protein
MFLAAVCTIKKRAMVAISMGKPPSAASLNAGIKEKSIQKATAPMRVNQNGHPQFTVVKVAK